MGISQMSWFSVPNNMKKRVHLKPDGTVLVTTFSEKYRKTGESEKDFMDRLNPLTALPFLDLEVSEFLPDTGPDGSCHECKRTLDLTTKKMVLDMARPQCVHDKRRRLEAALSSPDRAKAMDAMLELERMRRVP